MPSRKKIIIPNSFKLLFIFLVQVEVHATSPIDIIEECSFLYHIDTTLTI